MVNVRAAIPSPWGRRLYAVVERPVESFLGLDYLNAVYAAVAEGATGEPDPTFFTRTLAHLGVRYTVNEEAVAAIPRTGPVVVVANHPYGGLDGLILGAILTAVRPDVRFFASTLLARVAPLRPWLLAVDNFGGEGAERRNLAPLRESLRWLRSGGLLATFPAGEVSSWQVRDGRIADPAWTPHTGRLVRATGATVVPVRFHGTNSATFQMAGLVHPRLRTMLLPRELREQSRRPAGISVTVGAPLKARRLAAYAEDAALTAFLRLHTELLGTAGAPMVAPAGPLETMRRSWRMVRGQRTVPVVTAGDAATWAAELAALPADRRLAGQGGLEVWWLRAREAPQLLREVGRQRELTFRAVDEGTGQALDLDVFDQWYDQLVLWDPSRQQVAGGYRLGDVRAVRATLGRRALYTSTLFRYGDRFLDALGPAVEVGRSFITADYQRRPTALALLWKGIGGWLRRHPEVTRLFGPVSIDQGYGALSKDLMVEFLRRTRADAELTRLVRPRRPQRVQLTSSQKAAVGNVAAMEDVSALVSMIERDGRGVPVLWRQYVKLNARVVAFNRDPAFNNALDGLIVVDLDRVDPATLRYYMGADSDAS